MVLRSEESHSRRRQVRDAIIVLAISFFAVEAALQAAALTVWLRYRPAAEERPATSTRSVLCIGDSYTFGIGTSSSDHAYPAALERLLRQDEKAWRVSNAGWPGRNSREALSVIDEELARTQPALVYVLVGTNDTWTRPDRLDTGASPPVGTRFRWRWRTARFAALIATGWRNWRGRETAPAPPGPAAAATLADSAPATGARAPALAARPPSAAEARAAAFAESARILARAGKRAEAIIELQKLHTELIASDQAERIGNIYAATAVEVGEGEQALSVARVLSDKYPENADFARVIAWEAFQRHDLDTAVPAIDQAVRLGQARGNAAEMAFFLRQRALILFGSDRRRALDSGVASYLVDGNLGELRLLFLRDTQTFTPAFLETTLDAQQVPELDRVRIRHVLEEARGSSSAPMSTLASHLEQLVARIQSAGARAVLLSYPFPSDANAVARRVASESGAGWIDLEMEFADRLNTARRDELYVADGHLNDAGYAIVAEMVARDVKHQLLGAAPPPRPRAAWLFGPNVDGNAASLARPATEPETFAISIQRAETPNLWDIQLRRPKLPLEAGTRYEVTFRVRAGGERRIAYGVNTHDFRNIGLFEEVTIGPAWQEVRASFTPTESDAQSELHFDVGASTVSVELTDITLRRLSDGAAVESVQP